MTATRWARVRFHANYNDSRPVSWPPPGPFWETGLAGDESYAIVVAYFPVDREGELAKYWPDAAEVDWHRVEDAPGFTSRFRCPDWWDETARAPKPEEFDKYAGQQTYEVPWTVSGRYRVSAKSPEAAKAIVDAINPREYVEDGDLETFEAELVVEDER